MIITASLQSYSQGCVAVRSNGMVCHLEEPLTTGVKGQWLLSMNNRYFKSFRHYSGRDEQKQRLEQETEVINKSFSADITLTKIVNNRMSYIFNLPIIANHRSSLYEHGGKERHTTNSVGIGDVRFAAYRWMLDPQKSRRFNFQLGLGIKLPTGNYSYKDYFGPDSAQRLAPVDQSIQLGDGGTGLTVELNSFYNISRNVSVYSNIFYLANPREQNGTLNYKTATPSTSIVANKSDVMSVPDQYMLRAGVNYRSRSLTLGLGARMDAVPAEDIIGGSNGFRRPGYIIAAEPSALYQLKKVTLFLNTPIALVRNRTQSVPDKISSKLTGTKRIGDAAFADYVINIGISTRL
jgi:hypothetical protein